MKKGGWGNGAEERLSSFLIATDLLPLSNRNSTLQHVMHSTLRTEHSLLFGFGTFPFSLGMREGRVSLSQSDSTLVVYHISGVITKLKANQPSPLELEWHTCIVCFSLPLRVASK